MEQPNSPLMALFHLTGDELFQIGCFFHENAPSNEKINALILFSTRQNVIFMDLIDSLLQLKLKTQLFIHYRLRAEKDFRNKVCLLARCLVETSGLPFNSAGSTSSVKYLRAPLGVDGVAHHSGALLLAMVRQRGEDAVLPGLDGQLQVWVRIEEHPLL